MSISAKFLTAFIGGTEVTGVCDYSAGEVGDRIEATTGANNGRGKKDCGVIDTRIRVSIYVDFTTGEIVAVRAGTVLTSLELFASPDPLADPIYLIGSATVFESTFRGQVRDKFMYECEIEANGDVVTMNEPN